MKIESFYQRLRGFNFKFRHPSHYPIKKISNKKFVFIHINKTGGTSINSALGIIKKHLTAKEVIDLVGKKNFSKVFSFAVVRNPWDKVASQYHHRIRTQQINESISFNSWVSKTYGNHKDLTYHDKPYKMFYPQIEWLKDYSGEIVVNKIMRFEKLNEEYESIRKALSVNKKLPHKNKSSNYDYKTIYSDNSIEIVKEHFKEDIELFGYDF